MGHYSSVQEFNPANCDLKPVERLHTDMNEEEVPQERGPKTTKNEGAPRFKLPIDDGSHAAEDHSSHLGASSLQMKSLLKSFSNGNFQYYESLHKKYFEKAKEGTAHN